MNLPFKDIPSLDNNSSFLYYEQLCNEDSRKDNSLIEKKNTYLNLLTILRQSILTNDSSAIIKVLGNISDLLKSFQIVYEFHYAFLFDILNLLSYKEFNIQRLSSYIITEIIITNNSIGFFFLENNIIEIIYKEILLQNNLIIFFFPMIRVLSSLDASVLQLIINKISLSLFETCFEIKELNEELCLFLNNISCFQQTSAIQSFILKSIRRMYDLNYKKCFIYLACSLHQLSNFTNFCFDVYQDLKLGEFIDFALKETEFHCVLPICLFLSNLFKNHYISSISKNNLKLILKYSVNFNLRKRCEASIDLLINILEYGDMATCSYLLKVVPIGKTFIEILRDEKISFIFKLKISNFLMLFASKITFEEFSQLIAFDFFEVIKLVLILSDSYLIEKAAKLIDKSYQSFVAANTSLFFKKHLKESIDFDFIESNQFVDNENVGSLLFMLHKIIDDT